MKQKHIIIPMGVEKIKDSEYQANYTIESVIIPSSVKTIGVSSFCGCHNLKKVIIQPGCKAIRACAFHDCNNLKSIILPDSITVIQSHAFSQTGLNEITFGNNIKRLNYNVFNDTDIHTVHIGNGKHVIYKSIERYDNNGDINFYLYLFLNHIYGLNEFDMNFEVILSDPYEITISESILIKYFDKLMKDTTLLTLEDKAKALSFIHDYYPNLYHNDFNLD